MRSYRLVRPRTWGFQPRNSGSNPDGSKSDSRRQTRVQFSSQRKGIKQQTVRFHHGDRTRKTQKSNKKPQIIAEVQYYCG